MEQFIDKYEILTTLGRGSMGVVYKARDPEIGRVVAIKTLRSIFLGHDAAGEEALQRFRQEARSAGKLRHPNIVTIYDTGRTENGSPYIVMEFIEGNSLELIVNDRAPLDPLETLNYLGQIASAVDYAHSQVVIHRDIKPSNVIIDATGRPHLLDFGVAKLSDTSLTPAGTVVGTPSYMSPEQIRGERLDGGTDRFSLAVMAFEMFTGVRPFPGTDFTTVVSNIIHKPPLSFAEIGVELPPGLEAALQRGLSKEKDKRFGTALDLVDSVGSIFKVTVDGMGVPGYRPGMKINDFVERRSDTRSLTQTVNRRDYGLPPLPAESSIAAAEGGVSQVAPLSSAEPLIRPAADGYGGELEEEKSGERPTNGALHPSGGTLGVADTIAVGDTLSSLVEEPQPPPSRRPVRALGVVALSLVAVLAFLHWRSEESVAPRVDKIDESIEKPLPDEIALPNGETPAIVKKSVQPVTAEVLPGLAPPDLLAVLSAESDSQLLVKAVGEVGRRDFVPFRGVIVKLTAHKNYLVRIEAMKLLGRPERLRERDLYQAIADRLGDEDRLVRGFAVKILSMLPTENGLRLLERRLPLERDTVVQKVLRSSLERMRAEVKLRK